MATILHTLQLQRATIQISTMSIATTATMFHVLTDKTAGGAKFMMILAWIIVIGLVIWLIFVIINTTGSQPNTVYKQQTQLVTADNSIIGASTDGQVAINNGLAYSTAGTCNAGPTRVWGPVNSNQEACRCVAPFYGSTCFLESYDANYLAVGNPVLSDVTLPPTSERTTDRLSFPWATTEVPAPTQSICTTLCDDDDMCTGVLWDAPTAPDMGTSKHVRWLYIIKR